MRRNSEEEDQGVVCGESSLKGCKNIVYINLSTKSTKSYVFSPFSRF